MDYRLGKSKKIYDEGTTEKIECPTCKSNVEFSVFTNGDSKLVAKLPIIKLNTVYFLVCPKCGAVYGVDEAKGKSFKNGEKLAIGNYDLKELTRFNG